MNEKLVTRLALEVSKWHRQSKLAVERLVKKTDGWSTNTTLKFKVNSVYDLAQSIIEKRKCRAKVSTCKTLGERFDLVKRKRFLDAVRRASFRTSTTDIHITRVNFVSEVNIVGIECAEVKTRKDKLMSVHDFFPYTSWHKLPAYLRVIEGKLTLYASKKAEERGVEVYEAIWCQQGNGTSLRVVQGCIAVQKDKSKLCASHVEGVWEAITQNKALDAIKPIGNTTSSRRQREFTFVEEIYGNRIRVKESLKKFEKWCWSVGLNPESTRLTLGDLIRGYWVQPHQRIKELVRRIFNDVRADEIVTNSVKIGSHKVSMN